MIAIFFKFFIEKTIHTEQLLFLNLFLLNRIKNYGLMQSHGFKIFTP